ncbi:hypothetical protein G5I_11414 [Acromyrmex echinatior]|uniref:DUF243 domain-containing protein n=1 Tax=Acromyrmex echinatior TaxID=103372 RepID=F4WZI9_ACREC|nr:hypothetical protein G5I_11414 [Acromyrmex echinatior]
MLACIKRSFKTSAELQSSNQGTASTMRAFIILALAATAMALPEAEQFYNQPSPIYVGQAYLPSYPKVISGPSNAGGVDPTGGIQNIPARRSRTGFGAGGGFGGGFSGFAASGGRDQPAYHNALANRKSTLPNTRLKRKSSVASDQILALAATAMARPEAGYSYSQPSSSYGAPSGGFPLAGGVGGISGIGGFGGGGVGGFGGGPSVGGGTGGIDGIQGISSFGGGGGGGGIASIGGGVGGGDGISGAFGGGGGGFGGGSLIQKHIYVHVPPPEAPEARPARPISGGYQAQKHYKIIFIKAPTPPTPTAPIIPVQQQDEQKTLIYVLVKKPEEAPEINLPTITPTQPSKPEVYFIKYKTQNQNYELMYWVYNLLIYAVF